jgi:hypothetical protein
MAGAGVVRWWEELKIFALLDGRDVLALFDVCIALLVVDGWAVGLKVVFWVEEVKLIVPCMLFWALGVSLDAQMRGASQRK